MQFDPGMEYQAGWGDGKWGHSEKIKENQSLLYKINTRPKCILSSIWTLWVHINFQLLDFFSEKTIIQIGLSRHCKHCCLMKNWDWIILKGFRKWMNLQYIYVFLLFWSKKEWHIFPVQLRGSFMSSLNPPRMCKY